MARLSPLPRLRATAGTDLTPLVSFGVAPTDTPEASDPLTNLNTQGGLPVRYVPRPPWCDVVTHPGLAGDVEALGWLGDFERSLTRAGNLISTEAN